MFVITTTATTTLSDVLRAANAQRLREPAGRELRVEGSLAFLLATTDPATLVGLRASLRQLLSSIGYEGCIRKW